MIKYFLNIQFLSEWVIVSAMSSREQVNWIFIVIAHWHNNQWMNTSLHLDTFSWYRINKSLLFLLNAAYLAEKQQIPIIYFWVWLDRGSNSWSIALEASMLTITPTLRIQFIYDEIWWDILNITIMIYSQTCPWCHLY